MGAASSAANSLWNHKGRIIGGAAGIGAGPLGVAVGQKLGSRLDAGSDAFNLATASARTKAYGDKGTVGFRDGGLSWQKQPGPGPDLTDAMVREAQRQASLANKVGRTRGSSFRGGGY